MKVSILIPFYNASLFIERALLSALNQTYPYIECIMVDDGSKDESIFRIQSIIKNHKRKESTRVIKHDSNKGVASARNTCINNATGNYVFFLDSDDELPLNAIENLVKSNINSKADLVLGEFNVTGGVREKFVEIKIKTKVEGNNEIFNSFISHKWYDGTCNKLVKRKFLLDNNISFYANIVHEDILWSFEIAMKATLIIYCSEITYIYHLRSNSITQNMSERNFKSLIFIMKKMVEYDQEFKLHKAHIQLFNYYANLRIYFLKKLILWTNEKSIVKKMIDQINLIFSHKEYNKISNYSMESMLKLIPYKTSVSLSVLYIRLLLSLKKQQ
ncbi:glycosyltransferase involved in cell wall biosynthesis [Parabacteroides sp. PF5-5]|uniref:glycosyltransferase family 2 protein n=1 Tax=unclassified Parabacteroides TaxID=2649774 RepID=UPI002474592D|nr:MULTISPECIES: glycosyltransferase family 2 protein [unclassified Parabacteroides]MDH6306790.1 glycosyltransferase involved in cell wall biosynthesis [Parabacteroides sp. PH5-39]MDH6317676.1 glycosyltransferase involved in cell wall biosynthesis [Parabacteroides sp. PF5-13]MDH6321502.1 glycosyltransferase involved in cell wall biosynthesis [Parabacteroides sp. PH5-13]MDH6325221.1 glycosyltransferase involved in cell wall biosynthesis [Parabacteroides sp. PH5-8]MDH6328861.1 glycosyltransferas